MKAGKLLALCTLVIIAGCVPQQIVQEVRCSYFGAAAGLCPQPPGPPGVWGFADLHSHPASNFAFGGDSNGANGIFWGSGGGALSNYGRLSVDPKTGPYDAALAADLPQCSPDSHEGFDADPVRHETRTAIISQIDAQPKCVSPAQGGCNTTPSHGPDGSPYYSSWPTAWSIEHQQMHITAIRRAYEGGLRLMFASVTNDQLLSDLWSIGFNAFGNHLPIPESNFDYNSAQTQLAAIGRLVAANSDWMQIVTTPAEARQAINNRKLAVILSLEMDSLTVDQILSLVANNQVRHVIPIHLVNNSFGGTAVYSDSFNTLNNWANGSQNNHAFYRVVSDPCLTFRLQTPQVLLDYIQPTGWWPIFGVGAFVPSNISQAEFAALGYPTFPIFPTDLGGEQNAMGLSNPRNPIPMYQLMSAHVLLDIAHMGETSAWDALEIAQGHHYPIMDSHTALRDDNPASCARQEDVGPSVTFPVTERALGFSQAILIGRLHGVIGLGTSGLTNNSDPVNKWLLDYEHALSLIAQGNGGTPRGVALGTDMNGLSPQIAFDTIPTIYPITVAQSSSPPVGESSPPLWPFPENLRGDTYDFQYDGIANYGMLPDFIQALSQRSGSSQAINALYHSAEDVIEMWEAAESALIINPVISPPFASAGGPYSTTLSASGGSPPYGWTLHAGSLPPGLSLGNNGTIAGTPTTAGAFPFDVLVQDSATTTAWQDFTISVEPPAAKLTGVAVTFDDRGQGKDGNAHYWVYLYAGPDKSNQLASFAYSQDNQDGKDYSKPVTTTLTVTNPITNIDLQNDGGGSLEIDFHAQLGGFHQNSDWVTGVTLNLGFDDGSTKTVSTPGPIHLHGDESNPSETWRGTFNFTDGLFH